MRPPIALQEALDEFNARFPRPGIEALTISAPYDLIGDWPTHYPFKRHKGVYCFVDAVGALTYIGKASNSNDFGYRLAGYFGNALDGTVRVIDPIHIAARYIYFIALPEGHGFEAPAIEEWLISRLNPPLNKIGRKRNEFAHSHNEPIKTDTLPEINLEDDAQVDRAVRRAARAALRDHKKNGYPIVAWQDGKVIRIAPEDIVVPEEDE